MYIYVVCGVCRYGYMWVCMWYVFGYDMYVGMCVCLVYLCDYCTSSDYYILT